jgi:hypothetical protein
MEIWVVIMKYELKYIGHDLMINSIKTAMSIILSILCIILAYIDCTLLWMLLSSPLTAPGTTIVLGMALYIFVRYWLRER